MYPNVSPVSTGLKYGLILGLISVLFSVVMYATGLLTNQMASSIQGVFSLIASFAVIFFAIKHHKDVKQEGYIFLSKGFLVGLITAIVSALISVIFVYILFTIIDPGLIDEILLMTEERLVNQGLSEDMIEQSMAMTKNFVSPAAQAGFGFMGGICCGSVLSLIAGLILQKQPTSDF